jgi:hypothetical protein
LAGTIILQNSGGILSKYRNSCPQEFLRKITVKLEKKMEFLRPLQNHSCDKFLRKNAVKKRNPQESCQEWFFGPKKLIPENRNRQPSLEKRLWW